MKSSGLLTPIKVRYQALPLYPKISWPIVEADVSIGSKSLPQPLLCLVDSGASMSVLHVDVAEALGVNFDKLGKSKIGGKSVSGDYDSWNLPELADVEVYGYQFKVRFCVIDNRDLIWPCILGEDSIFQRARVDFLKFKGYFKISFRGDLN